MAALRPSGIGIARRGTRLVVLALIPLGLGSCMSAYFYDMAVARSSKDFLARSRDLDLPKKDGKSAFQSSWLESQPFETLKITSRDGLSLVAYWLPAAEPTANTVILAHGYSSRAMHMSDFARFYHEQMGWNVLLPDARGHGASEGAYIGFGWPDRLDYLQWIDLAIARTGAGARIVLHGISMGGATVLMVSGESLPSNVVAVVEDCGYTSADDVLTWQLRRMYNLPREPLIPDTSRLTKQRAGYSFEEASALEAVKRSRIPTLFIHGDADTFVPFDMVHRLYDACPAEKELFVVHGATHGMSFWTDQAGYEAAVRAFLGRHLPG
jgi:uncharacterized protein